MKILGVLLGGGLVAIMSASPVRADDAAITEIKQQMEELRRDYEARIQELETKVEQLQNQQQTTQAQQAQAVSELEEKIETKTLDVEYVGRRNAPIGAGGLLVKNPFGFGNVSLGGYFDMEYHDFENTESTFRQHRWIINIGSQLHERLRFNSELEIEYGGPNIPSADGEIKVEQAYGDYLINDAINLRAGALLTPFGRYNLYHDADLQDLTDRPIVARDIVPTTWTEAGYGFFGEFNPIIGSYEDLLWKYEVYAVNGLDAGFSDTGLSGAKGGLKTDNNDNKAVVGRVTVSPFLGQEFAASGYWGEYNSSDDAISGIGFDSLSAIGPFELINEYAYFGVEEEHKSADLANFFQGAYTQLNYHFWPKWLNDTFLGRNFEHPTFTLIGRYEWGKIHDDSDTTIGDNEETRWTLGWNYRPVENFVFKFEYQWNQANREALERGDSNGFLTSIAMGF